MYNNKHYIDCGENMQKKDLNKTVNKSKCKRGSFLKNNKGFVYYLGSIIAVVIIAAIAWAITPLLNRPGLGDDFFVSDETKTTISLTPSNTSSSTLHETHIVYDYDDDDNVIRMKTYFEYPDTETAEIAYGSLKDQPEFKGAELRDNFIIVTADESQYKGLTASDIRQQADAIRAFQAKSNPESASEEQDASESESTDQSEPEE